MGIKDWFSEPKSPEEIEEENNRLEVEDRNVGYKLSIAKQNALIKELEARGKKWQDFSDDGTKKGFMANIDKATAWVQGH